MYIHEWIFLFDDWQTKPLKCTKKGQSWKDPFRHKFKLWFAIWFICATIKTTCKLALNYLLNGLSIDFII